MRLEGAAVAKPLLRRLPFVLTIAIAALAVAWMSWGPVLGAGSAPAPRSPTTGANDSGEERRLFDTLNDHRRSAGAPVLAWDDPSASAIRGAAAEAVAGGKLDRSAFERKITEQRGRAVPWRYRLLRWQGDGLVEAALDSTDLLDPEYTHASVGVARDAAGATAAGIYLCRPPARLGRAHANGQDGQYLVRCPNCQRERLFNLDFPQEAQFYCPSCQTLVSAYLDDSGGVNHWATWFTQPYAPDRVTNPFLAWQWVNERIRYDHRKADRDLPGWQSPRETCRRATGVCRDTAVLLGAWLRAAGHDARVITGLSGKDAHAWVVLFDGPHAYLLESAMDGRMSRRYPPRLETVTDYYPTEMMFDDKRVWVNRGQQRVRDYASPSVWLEIKENP